VDREEDYVAPEEDEAEAVVAELGDSSGDGDQAG
jgi:hypothetical protein